MDFCTECSNQDAVGWRQEEGLNIDKGPCTWKVMNNKSLHSVGERHMIKVKVRLDYEELGRLVPG